MDHLPLTDLFEFDIRPYTTDMTFESGDHILFEGTVPEYLYYLFEGKAKLYLSHKNGRTTLINFLSAPCFIGEMELLGARETSNGVIAVTRCCCHAIHIQSCKEQLLNDTTFLRHLCLLLSQKAVENTDNYSVNQSFPLEVRLARFILMTEHNGLYREKHTEVAEFLGVTYRHLLYVLADFVKRGVLEKMPQGYHIKDDAVLKKYAYVEC